MLVDVPPKKRKERKKEKKRVSGMIKGFPRTE
jgi:hypothetical protein